VAPHQQQVLGDNKHQISNQQCSLKQGNRIRRNKTSDIITPAKRKSSELLLQEILLFSNLQ